MAWQQMVADVLGEIDPATGRLVYDEYALTVPRQSGKSTFILAKATHRASASGFFGVRQRLVYTAQTRLKAREKWAEDFVPDLQASPRFASRVKPNYGGGNEHVRFPNGSRFGIEANTEKAGHGQILDEAYIDEAFAHGDNRLELAFGPAMITRANKQLGVISTAGWLDASPYLLEKVNLGRALVGQGVREGMAYFEWSAPDDADPADEDVWYGCMPGLHRPDCPPGCVEHVMDVTAIRNEHLKASRSGKMSDFRRAYLNQWVPKPRAGDETALGNWNACKVALEQQPKPVAVGLAGTAAKDAAQDREYGSIGAAGWLPDGRPVVGAVDRREGVDWLVDEAVRLQRTYGCAVVVAAKGPVGDLIPKLDEAGVNVTKASLDDYVEHCALMYDRVQTQRIVHEGHPDLDEAVAGARWKVVADRRVFGRRVSSTDVSMLEACTLAAGAAELAYDVLDSVM